MKSCPIAKIGALAISITILAACTGEKVISEIQVVATPTSGPTPTPFVVLVAPTPTPQPGPLSVIEAYVGAINGGDIAALAAIYADDIVIVQSVGPSPSEGKVAVVSRDGLAITDNTRLTISNASVEGDTVRGVFSASSDELKEIGIASTTGAVEATVKGGAIFRIVYTYDRETSQKLSKAFDPPSVVNAFLDAWNAGDVDRMVALYCGCTVHISNGRGTLGRFETTSGKENLAQQARTESSSNAKMLISNASVAGNTVTARFSYTTDRAKELGNPPATGGIEFVVRSGKIASTKVTYDEETLKVIRRSRESPSPLEVVNSFVEAFNTRDVAALAAIYAEDVVFSFGPFPPAQYFTEEGKAAVMAEQLDDMGQNARLTVSNASVEGNTVSGKLSYVDDESRSLGELTGMFEAVVEHGRITRLKATFDETTQEKLRGGAR